MVDCLSHWSTRAEIPLNQLLLWLGIPASKYYDWRRRYGLRNAHNAHLPRRFWLLPCEKQAILDYQLRHPNDGYRRLCFMMLDADVVAVSPSSVYRVLKDAGRLDSRTYGPSAKGQGFVQPDKPHEHWHIDVSYLNICGTFYYLCTILDGYSRYIVHWEIREAMTEADVETILQRGREAFPGARPRIISDNGPQFIARDFKEFVRLSGMTHVRTSPFYRRAMAKSKAGTRPSNASASAPRRHSALRMLAASWPSSCASTTRCACTAASPM